VSTLPEPIKHIFFAVMQGKLSIADFEQWVYTNKELEQVLTEEQYLSLIAFNYKQPRNKYELFELLSQYVSLGEYEKVKLKALLYKAKQRNMELPSVLEEFYDWYCRGYSFLTSLGMGYGLYMTYLQQYGGKHWSKLTAPQLEELVESFSPALEAEIEQVERWLDNGKIVLTGEQDELGHYDYVDYRTTTEKNMFTETPVYKPKPKKQWWKWPWK
jgi:hypothetical protein